MRYSNILKLSILYTALLVILVIFQPSTATALQTAPGEMPTEVPFSLYPGLTRTFNTSSGAVTLTIEEAAIVVSYDESLSGVNPSELSARKKQQANYLANIRSAARPTQVGLEEEDISDPTIKPGIKHSHTARGDFNSSFGRNADYYARKLSQGEVVLKRFCKIGNGERNWIFTSSPVLMTASSGAEHVSMLFNPPPELEVDWQQALQKLEHGQTTAQQQKGERLLPSLQYQKGERPLPSFQENPVMQILGAILGIGFIVVAGGALLAILFNTGWNFFDPTK